MQNSTIRKNGVSSVLVAVVAICCVQVTSVSASENHTASDFSSMPIAISLEGVKPRVMINASNDHQLYFKAYNDYSDLDGDGISETTYKHAFNYYGYFDSYKCYTYSTLNRRFEPRSFTTDKYCYSSTGDNDANKGEWSGNFLNWASMSRIDSIRKILFGGHRRIDTATDTTLERSYLPHDAHSWAKYYGGADLYKLTPFKPATSATPGGVEYLCDEGNAMTGTVVNPLCKNPSNDPYYYACSSAAGATNPAACADTTDPFNYNCADNQDVGSPGYTACKGINVRDPRYRRNRFAYNPAEDYQDADWDGTPVDRRKLGITLGNTTDVNYGLYPANTGSAKYSEPPLIKVARENYTLWGSNEATQIAWAGAAPTFASSNSNANDPARSWIPAYSSNPNWSNRLGEGNYIARVQACVPGLIDSELVDSIAGSTKEKCKLYPGPDKIADTADDNYKPVGLLQSYGDDDKMLFGMVAGSYTKHTAGGELVRNLGSFADEVNVDSDGTFPKVARFASDSSPLGPTVNGEGIVNAWSLYRILDFSQGNYNNAYVGNCPWGLSTYNDLTNDNRCRDWGNPFAEIYLQSIKYLADGTKIDAFNTASVAGIPGLPPAVAAVDPLKTSDYCAQLNVINLNASVVSYDFDQLDGSYGPQSIWDSADLPGAKNTTAMANVVGAGEGIHGNRYFVGGINIGGTTDNQLCTPKTVSELGKVGGVCPEAPRLNGSYRIAGLAYYAHTRDIRPDSEANGLPGDQVVNTYSVALASGVPVIQIPDPEDSASKSLATILPACRNSSIGGNCAIVDFKLVAQNVDAVGKRATGRFYIDWEDSEQGGDYDQDMWGTLDYVLDKVAGTLTITTQVQANSAGYALGFGYVLGGTSDDGFHAHSGIVGYKNTETADAGYPDCSDANGCNCAAGYGQCNTPDSGPSRKTYALASSTTKLLEDPLWYASKWGGFVDMDDNKLPNLIQEWDSKINATGGTGSDGIPDNYFYASNPRQLEESLERVFKAILERTSSGTAAAVVSSNVGGEGALYQAYYEPLHKNGTQESRWLGTVQALWRDSASLSRQDCTPPADTNGINSVTGKCLPFPNNLAGGKCTPNGRLDNYCVDQVVRTYYDSLEKKAKARVFESDLPMEFTSYSMQGVVASFSAGAVTMIPNSMEGNVTYTAAPEAITISPYVMTGQVISYDPDSGAATVKITAWNGPAGTSYSSWGIETSSSDNQGYTVDTLAPTVDGNISFSASPVGNWLQVGDAVTLKTKNLIGASGAIFSGWTVECIAGGSAVGIIDGVSRQLNNTLASDFSMTTDTGDFTSCTRARVSTYNMQGEAGKQFSQWTVTSLGAIAGTGTSATPMLLSNSGQRSFTVTPTESWLSPGEQVLVANNSYASKNLYELGYLWNAREQLYLPGVSDEDLATNRVWNLPANKGRYITTWVDANLNGILDTGEYRAFEKSMLTSVSHTFFDVSDAATAGSVIDYVRGIESSGSRNRTVKYGGSDTAHVMRLGDIINSTPSVVGSPQEAFNLLYGDSSYRKFLQKYISRRIVVYAGGNDGLLHAFNGGFYNKVSIPNASGGDAASIAYSVNGTAWNGADAVAHPLGGEIWAYAPFNLLTHLQWLRDPEYGKSTHVSYVDQKPRIFDAKIFEPDGDHPEGWGTVMVVGMNLGGGSMKVSVDQDNDASTEQQVVQTRSAYIVFDITNPEVAPQLMAELPMPDGSYSTVYPAVAAFQDVGGSKNCQTSFMTETECNSWYLVFGNGPDSPDYVSSQSAKVYLYDLGQLRSKSASPGIGATVLPIGCEVRALNAQANLIVCDTQQANSFMGTPVVVDWNLDFRANTSYFGLIGRQTTETGVVENGRVMRFGFNNEALPSAWSPLTTFYDTGKPVVAQPVPSFDDTDKHWLFFGTGRYYTPEDKSSTYQHHLFGVKDMEDSNYPVAATSLLDVSHVEVYADGNISPSVTPVSGASLTTFEKLEEEIDDNALGWTMYLEPILGDVTDPSTRMFTRPALFGGVLFSTVFQPSSDPCSGEGLSRLFGLYYKTGTAHPRRPVFGVTAVPVNGQTKAQSNKFQELGDGNAAEVVLQSNRDGSVTATSAKSAGDIVETPANTILKVRSGRISWQEK